MSEQEDTVNLPPDVESGAPEATGSKRGQPEQTVTPGDREKPREIGGPKGLEPTRYGDWEKNGRCIDF